MIAKTVGVTQPFRPASTVWFILADGDARELRAQSYGSKAGINGLNGGPHIDHEHPGPSVERPRSGPAGQRRARRRLRIC